MALPKGMKVHRVEEEEKKEFGFVSLGFGFLTGDGAVKESLSIF